MRRIPSLQIWSKGCPGTLALAILGVLAAPTARADATLHQINDLQKLTVGIILQGAPFGYIDPQTRTKRDFNIDLARALAVKPGVKVELVEGGPADGFNVMPPFFPDGLDDFVRGVVPLLQERRLFRTAYSGTTLRAHFGPERPGAIEPDVLS